MRMLIFLVSNLLKILAHCIEICDATITLYLCTYVDQTCLQYKCYDI